MATEECCNNRQNFGHPDCGLGVFSNVVKPIFVPLKTANGNATTFNLNAITTELMTAGYMAQNPADRLFGFPVLENFVWSQADSLTEETSSGSKFFLREGVVSITGELFKKDATPTMKGKVSGMRCADWGVFFVTNTNQLIGAGNKVFNVINGLDEDVLIPIPISNESVNGIFSPTQDSSAQKIMFSFDLDRNFDTKDLYMIEGDKMANAAGDVIGFDFLDTIAVIDCNLDVSSLLLSDLFVSIEVTDDYRQGYRSAITNGNVTGLGVADFKFTDLITNANVIPDSVVEAPTGYYDITLPLSSIQSGTPVKVELVLDGSDPSYDGQVTYLVP